MNSCPKVTVLVGTYNHKNVVVETLKSIDQQTYKNIDVIISDDGSTDGTREILTEFVKNRSNFSLHLQEKNLGITKNYNFLADKAAGDYVATFSGDDVMCSNKIELQVNLLESNPSASFCHHAVYDLDADSNKVRGIISHHYLNGVTTIHDVLRNFGIPGSMSVMYRKNMVTHPVFHPEIKMASDWFHVITLVMAGAGLYIDKPLCYYRRDSKYNNKDVSKYEMDFLRTIELARERFSNGSDDVNKSCDYALSRYSLGAAYRYIISGDKKSARECLFVKMIGWRYKTYAFILFLLSFMPLRITFFLWLKSGYKKISSL